jgi:hypothetical protein
VIDVLIKKKMSNGKIVRGGGWENNPD